MIGNETPADIAACICLATALFGGSLVPFFLLIEERPSTSPALKRAALTAANAMDRARLAAVNALLALLRLATRKGGGR